MTSTKWWNTCFLLSFPHKTLILTNSHGWECLCGSLGVYWRCSSILLKKKNLTLDALKRVRGTALFYLHLPSPKTAQLKAKRDLHGPHFSQEGKWEHVCEHLGSPVMWGDFKEVHFFLAPSRILGRAAQESRRGWKNRSQRSQRASKGHGSY